MRRLLLVAAVAGAAFVPSAPASADPPCYGVFAGEHVVGYCAGFVCTDLCFWVSYPICEQPADSPTDHCAAVHALLGPIG